jgi:TolB-like protein
LALTQAGVTLGTPAYMAPEQWVGDIVDGRADLYAWGVVAYELLVGRPPFVETSAQRLMVAHLMDEPIPLATLAPTVPHALAELVMRCLAKESDHRPANAAAVLAALDGAPLAPTEVPTAQTARATNAIPAVAVLPFANLSGDGRKAYLSDGLAAELRSTLLRNPALKVVGQASSNEFRDRKEGSPSIARKLGVANLVDGNVLSENGRVRIGIELIDGMSGFSRWSDRFELPMANIIDLQGDIAEAVGSALAVRLTDNGQDSPARTGRTKNVAAFDAFLRGKYLFDSQRDEDSDRAALLQFTDAVRLDPAYAAARAARSRALAVIANAYAQAIERRPLYEEAVQEARRAIASADQYAEGFAALGYASFYGKLDILAAERPYEKASQLGNGSADVLGLYAIYRARRGGLNGAPPVSPT